MVLTKLKILNLVIMLLVSFKCANCFHSYFCLHRIISMDIFMIAVSSHFHLLFGGNGAGKSVFLQAIDFLLRFENKQTSKGNIANLLSQRETKGFIEILFSGCNTPFENEITVRKEFSLITNVTFYFNGKKIDKKKIMALFEALSLNYMHSSFLMTPLTVQKFMKLSRKGLFNYLMKNMGVTFLKTYGAIQKIFIVLEDQKEKIDHLRELFQDVNSNNYKNDLMLLKKHQKIKTDILAEILKKKIQKLSKMIAELEGELSSLQKSNFDGSVSSTISLLQYSFSQIETALHEKEAILNSLTEESYKLIEKKEKINLSVQDITQTIYFIQKGREETSKLSEEYQAEEKIKTLSEELDNIIKELASKKIFLTELNSEKQLKETVRLNLLSKIQRTRDFGNEEERNSELQIKLKSVSEQIVSIEEEVTKLSLQKEELLGSKRFMEGEIKNVKQKLLKQESYSQNIVQAKQELNNYFDSMSDIQREETILDDEISAISSRIQEKVLQLKKRIGSAIIIGAESLLTVIEACKSSTTHQWLSESYYGMVIENFECHEELSIALESAIGNRLFAHVVSNNKAGTGILKEINNHKLAGEINILPIENLIKTSYNYPKTEGAEPILNRIKFKPLMEKVMKHLFGHVLICKNIDIAINIMRKTRGLTCVTLEGDKVSASVLSGGYFSKSKCSKILFSEINHLQETYAVKCEELKKLQNKMNELETKINHSTSYIQQLKKKYFDNDLEENLQRLIDDEKQASSDLLSINRLIEYKKYCVRELEVSQRMLIEEISEDFEEINRKISDDVMLLNQEIEEYKKILYNKNYELTTLEHKKAKLENDLHHQRKLKDLQDFDTSETKTLLKKLKDYKVKEEIIDNRTKIITNKVKEIKKSIIELNSQKLKLEEEIKQQSELDISIGRREKLTNKILRYNNQISEYQAVYNKIHKTSSHSNEYSQLTLPMLFNELRNLNKILNSILENSKIERRKKKIGRLCKKYDRLFKDFTNNYIIYSKFVDWFHNYMDQCLNSLSDNFSEYFESFSSGGHGNLFLDCDELSGSWPAFENITGLQMCIQFPNSDIKWNLMDLSFSQSLLVALAFKLSVIKSFLVPVFIIDEIDRPLYEEQKKIVCHQISRLEGQLQTFAASHSKEWIKLGKNVYHVTIKYTGSCIKKLTETQAACYVNEIGSPDVESYSFGSG